KEITEQLLSMPIFDTHEHLMSEGERRLQNLDVFYLFSHYIGSDLVSSGMSETDFNKILDKSIDIEERWNIFLPYLENVRNTSYFRIVFEAVNGLFGIDGITKDSYMKLSQKLEETKKKDWYEDILSKKCRIEYMLDFIENMPGIKDQRPLAKHGAIAVKNFDDIVSVCCMEDIFRFEKKYNTSIYKFKDYLDMIDRIFEDSKKAGYKVLKIVIAYFRIINFEEVTFAEADKVFSRFFMLKDYGFLERVDFLSKDELKPLQDFLIHYIIQKAITYSWPVQIHSGLLNGNRNNVANSNPCFLINLFLKYRNCSFDIFHAGFPFTEELIAITKQFTNVYFDLCWIQQVSFKLYKDILGLALETIPSNKIFAFGGDNFILECTYGSQKIVRRLISEVMYEKVSDGYFTFDQAIKTAEKILYLNPKSVYSHALL
ncbi:MAG: amidohydrolase family protein, partial [Candidatus Humimicrobiaceae bacterium]